VSTSILGLLLEKYSRAPYRNPFDIVGAREAGWNAIWVDRAGKGWVDKLGYPTRIIGNLEEIVDIIHKV